MGGKCNISVHISGTQTHQRIKKHMDNYKKKKKNNYLSLRKHVKGIISYRKSVIITKKSTF